MPQTKKPSNLFASFTNLYSLSKTLRFKLKPVMYDEDTKDIVEDRNFTKLKEYGVIEKDEQTARNIKAAKFYLDILHREFIDGAFANLRLRVEDLESVDDFLQELEKNSKDKKIDKGEKKKKNKNLRDKI